MEIKISRSTKTALVILIMVAYLVIPFYLIYRYQNVLSNGKVCRFQSRPVDPFDAFRGKYITLSFRTDSILRTGQLDNFNGGDDAYLVVKTGSNGLSEFAYILSEPPEDTGIVYIKTKVNKNWSLFNTRKELVIPFNRYYLPEEMAPKAEEIYRRGTFARRRFDRVQDSVYVDVRIKDGVGVIEELYYNGIPIKEYVNNYEKYDKEREDRIRQDSVRQAKADSIALANHDTEYINRQMERRRRD